MARTDLHRPSALVPADYEFVATFVHARYDMDGECVDEGYGLADVEEFLDTHEGDIYGHAKKCGSCGARFHSGALLQHIPSGDAVFVGADCAETIGVLVDWSQAELCAKRAADRRKLAMQRAKKAQEIQALFDNTPGLEDAMSADHYIIRDIRGKLSQYGSISDAQIALVFKLADEVKERGAEKKCPAPEGRVTFSGKIVKIAAHDTMYGTSIKATIKVTNEREECWLAWVTVPSSCDWNKGDEVTLTATLTASGSSPHFAFGKRPTVKK